MRLSAVIVICHGERIALSPDLGTLYVTDSARSELAPFP